MRSRDEHPGRRPEATAWRSSGPIAPAGDGRCERRARGRASTGMGRAFETAGGADAGHGPRVTALSASAQNPAASAMSRRPVGSRPSCQAKPATWKPSHPITQFSWGITGMWAKLAASPTAKRARSRALNPSGRALASGMNRAGRSWSSPGTTTGWRRPLRRARRCPTRRRPTRSVLGMHRLEVGGIQRRRRDSRAWPTVHPTRECRRRPSRVDHGPSQWPTAAVERGGLHTPRVATTMRRHRRIAPASRVECVLHRQRLRGSVRGDDAGRGTGAWRLAHGPEHEVVVVPSSRRTLRSTSSGSGSVRHVPAGSKQVAATPAGGKSALPRPSARSVSPSAGCAGPRRSSPLRGSTAVRRHRRSPGPARTAPVIRSSTSTDVVGRHGRSRRGPPPPTLGAERRDGLEHQADPTATAPRRGGAPRVSTASPRAPTTPPGGAPRRAAVRRRARTPGGPRRPTRAPLVRWHPIRRPSRRRSARDAHPPPRRMGPGPPEARYIPSSAGSPHPAPIAHTPTSRPRLESQSSTRRGSPPGGGEASVVVGGRRR